MKLKFHRSAEDIFGRKWYWWHVEGAAYPRVCGLASDFWAGKSTFYSHNGPWSAAVKL